MIHLSKLLLAVLEVFNRSDRAMGFLMLPGPRWPKTRLTLLRYITAIEALNNIIIPILNDQEVRSQN